MNNVKSIQLFNNSVSIFKKMHCKNFDYNVIRKLTLESITTISRGIEKESILEITKKDVAVNFIKKIKIFHKGFEITNQKFADDLNNLKI